MSSDGLKRQLGFLDSVAINVGVIIGVGIFRVPAEVAKYVNTPILILATWVLGGLVSLLGVFCYAELASCLPHTGGTYVYLRETYGKAVGFLFGWAEFSIVRAGSIAAVAYILTNYLGNLIPLAASHEKIFTIAVITFFTAINILGIQIGTRVQHILTALKIASILAIVGFIFYLRGIPAANSSMLTAGVDVKSFFGIAPALIPVLFTYGGWHQSTFMSGEFQDTRKALPLSLITGILVVACVYLLVNIAYLRMMGPAQMVESKAIVSDIFRNLFGTTGKLVISAVVVVSASGALNSTILTGGRIPFAVARDYPRLSWFAGIHPRLGTPMRSLLLNSIWASLLVIWGNFEQLLFFYSFANWLFFALIGLSVILLRRKQSEPGSFLMIGYPWVPILFILSSVWLCGISVAHAPFESFIGLVLLLAGLPIYWVFRERRPAPSAVYSL